MNVIAQILTLLGIVATTLLISGLQPIFLIPCYGILALAGIVAWSPKRRFELSPRVIPCLVATGVFFGYILLRIALSPVDYIARADLFMVLAALVVYLVTALCATSPTSRIVFTTAFLILACAQVIVGAIQFTKGNNFMPFELLPRDNYGRRASGFFGCPNHLAGFLEMTMLMALSLTFWSRWRMIGKIIAGYIAIVCAVGLALTGSRGGYASAGVGLLVFAVISLALARNWMWREIWLLLVNLLVLAVIGAICLGYYTLHSSDFLAHRINAAGADAPFRLGLWKAAFHQFQISPIFGTGSATYLYFGRMFREPGVEQDPIYAHSDFLQLLAEFGLVAIAGVAALLYTHIRSGWTFIADVIARRTVEGERDAPGFHGDNSLALTTGALCGIAALVAHSVFDFNLHIPPNTLILAFLFGTLANPFSVLVPQAKNRDSKAQKFLHLVPVALPLVGIGLAAVSFPKWPAERIADEATSILANGSLLIDPESMREAASLAQKALDRDPKNPEMYLALGDSFRELAELEDDPAAKADAYSKSIDAYQNGLKIAPLEVRFIAALAGIYDDQKRFDEAAPLHKRILELDKNSNHALWGYANHLYLQGKFDEAEAVLVPINNHFGAYELLARVRADRKALAEPPKAP